MLGRGAIHTRAAFTITELLVVSAVLALLTGLLLPSLSGARSAARQSACAAMQKQLVGGLLKYAADQDEWVPGYNTSGRSLWPSASERAIGALSRHSEAPVQINDWISPALAGNPLPTDRHERFYWLLEQMSCPCMELRAPIWFGGAGGDRGGLDMLEWMEERGREPARGVSYLMPTNFQLYGGPRVPRDPIITQHSSTKLQELARVCRLRGDYRPRVDSVGAASRKIAVADGFRYLGLRVIDFDASYTHANWGSFSERSACDIESRSWGRTGGGGTGFNLSVVYRHTGRINAAMWDGHVEPLGMRASRDPGLWAPSGSMLMPAVALDPDSKGFGVDPTDPMRNRIH
ncbi:MAG: hypothetical protein JNK58_00310 [Phycisphaerae bacterium]|nr:hypothetical protein [Phycisphaerae bacterium]